MNKQIADHFFEARDIISQFINNESNINNIENAGSLMVKTLEQGGKIMSCGNGGSLCDAMHFAEELTGRFRDNRPAIGALAIADASHLSCVSNDFGYDEVFSRYVEGIGRKEDLILGISTSGNSGNIIKAFESADKMGLKKVALTGKDGGKLSSLADVEIRAPQSQYADRAQEIHIKVIHSLIDYIENHYAGD